LSIKRHLRVIVIAIITFLFKYVGVLSWGRSSSGLLGNKAELWFGVVAYLFRNKVLICVAIEFYAYL